MGRHRSSAKRAGRPVRTGLLGASAALAMGAVAVATGLLPGGVGFVSGDDPSPSSGGQVRGTANGLPELQTQGDAGAGSAGASPSTRPTPPQSPSKAPAPSPAKPSAAASAPAVKTPAPKPKVPAPAKPPAPAPERPAAPSTPPPAADTSDSPSLAEASSPSERAAEAEVLALVNQERAKVGCAPVRFDASLARLAGAFSSDMAQRGFFSHTDPDGDTPWDRAEQAGVANMGGENIARGQADAGAVMNSWMNSQGHRENILNCDYKTLGVGVDMRDGGPWWTQNFGF
ncbi:CAP domain-containing protein [Streptomyces sp. NPDC020965]|uniref:CAP domain-containing protein n=1 Tax=Streptomyces sp. NPDC020965 TaxID=3365105 RepID=UPI003794AE3C